MALREEGYWDGHYSIELKNFEEDGDEGEVWFGKRLNQKIVDWVIDKLSSLAVEGCISKILDIGCGNAFLLYTLLEKYRYIYGCTDGLKLYGFDYSRQSICLSEKIILTKGLNDYIDLRQCDFLNIEQVGSTSNGQKFDFIIDKGTFDAICLLSSNLEDTKLKYKASLHSILKSGTIFILASCNHTSEELLPLFECDSSLNLTSKLIDRIETPKFQFGGKEGSQVTCLIVQFSQQ